MSGSPFSNIRLGVVTPMANERPNAVDFTRDVLSACEGFPFTTVRFYAILDNVSTDGTLELMREMALEDSRVRVVWAPENRSVVDAYVRGYREALADPNDWILEIDAGYSHRPEDIGKFFNKMAEGFDCVFASRYRHGGRMAKIHPINYFISRGGTWLANRLLGTRLSDMTSGFELFRAEVLREILDRGLLSRGSFFQTEIKAHAHGYRIAEVGIVYQPTPSRVRASEIRHSLDCLRRLRRQFRAGVAANEGEGA